MDISLKQLQEEHLEWDKKNFDPAPSYHGLLGIAEEVGELCHTHLKNEQGIRKVPDVKASKEDAIADIIIFAAKYCNKEGIDMGKVLTRTWNEVKKRDWQAFPKDGLTE